MATAAANLMTTEEFLALPDDDDVERDLIRGKLYEEPMTKRSRRHARSESRVAQMLNIWLDAQPEPRGEVCSGEIGFRIRSDPDTIVGIDVAYASAELAAATSDDASYFDGPPTLAVEILSPSDRQERIDAKVTSYLDAGVPLVWVVNPRFRTVTVFRPGAEPELFNARQEITAEPHLPGFRVPVVKLFRS
jgi:Uma2 family endonuclease